MAYQTSCASYTSGRVGLSSATAVVADAAGREQAQHGSPLFPIACYAEDLSCFSVAWHWHEEFEFILAALGPIHVDVNKTRLTLQTGQGVFINSGALHAVEPAEGRALLHSGVFSCCNGTMILSLYLPDKWRTTMATLQHTDELYHILEDEICALKILPGEALSENQLCKRFGVSRTPIRSVLQRLEQNRFVQIIPCKGTIVTAIDTGVVDQLIFQRVAVEGMVFRDFVQSCSPMEILAVEHLYNMLLEAAAGRSDPENFDFNHFLSCDLAMHEYWFHKTSKEYLWEQMTRPQADYSRFIRLDIVGARNVSSVVSEHAEMLRILREKDLDAIEPLMRTHLYGGVSRMGSKIYSDEYRGYFKLPENKK